VGNLTGERQLATAASTRVDFSKTPNDRGSHDDVVNAGVNERRETASRCAACLALPLLIA
jgi:hypothetical protein